MNTSRTIRRVIPKPGQESVWDYPRPPRVESALHEIEIVHEGEPIASSVNTKRVLETSHPPVYYVPPKDIRMDLMIPNGMSSFCEWKGQAVYFDLEVRGIRVENVAWSYLNPQPSFASIRNHLAFYAHLLDACFVAKQQVLPQPGHFYGGWITPDIVGPFKGEAGTAGW